VRGRVILRSSFAKAWIRRRKIPVLSRIDWLAAAFP
jgi:hypothetical protein